MYVDIRVSEGPEGRWQAGVADACGSHRGDGATPGEALLDLAFGWSDAQFEEVARLNQALSAQGGE